MKYKPIIEIKKDETTKYRILNGLSKKREYHIDNMDDTKRYLIKSIGMKTKVLKLDYPIVWHTPKSRHNDKRLLKLPDNVDLIEKNMNEKIVFQFQKKILY